MIAFAAAIDLKRFVAFASEQTQGAKIVEIQVEGNKAVHIDAILGLMDTKVGSELDPSTVS